MHPIEAESYRILASRVDLSGWSGSARAVVARMVHATADESFAASARVGSRAVASGVDALRRQATVVCDATMVLAGIPAVTNTRCWLAEVPTAPEGSTRAAAAMELAATEHPRGALWVVGNAPTALAALLVLCEHGAVEPAAIVGVPVGYVGAAEAKAALWASEWRDVAITNVGERGGSPVAAAAVNALAQLAGER